MHSEATEKNRMEMVPPGPPLPTPRRWGTHREQGAAPAPAEGAGVGGAAPLGFAQSCRDLGMVLGFIGKMRLPEERL